jgi:ABC-type transporter Mla subunit MlaD
LQRIDKRELNKIGTVTLVGVAALVLIIFWLKGHKIHQYQKFTFHFRNVNGLEEGNALRWNGLKIGLVDSINPVTHSFKKPPLPAKALIELGERHLAKARDLLRTHNLGDLIIAQEEITKAELEIALGRASYKQTEVTEESFVEVNVVVTTPDVPIGPLNQVTIVPSGIIGEQYVDLSTIEIDKDFKKQYDITTTEFIVLEPIRLDSLIRANTESAIAIKNLTNRLNALFSNNDAENVSQLVANSEQATQKLNKTLTPETINDFQTAMNNIRDLSDNFTLWKFLGLSNNHKKVKAQVK